MSNVKQTLAGRGKKYGKFMDNARVAQNLKDVVREEPMYQGLDPTKREALDMIFTKIARAITGDPEYPDNWHDIQGFANLAEDNCQ